MQMTRRLAKPAQDNPNPRQGSKTASIRKPRLGSHGMVTVQFSDGHSLSEYVYTGPGPTEVTGELSSYDWAFGGAMVLNRLQFW
jgi:hypothetical protein